MTDKTVAPPNWLMSCQECDFNARFWERASAHVMAEIHQRYGGHLNVQVSEIQNPRWSA